jgi:hypothetical protein
VSPARLLAAAALCLASCALRVEVRQSAAGSERPVRIAPLGAGPVLVLREYRATENGQPYAPPDALREAFLRVLRASDAFQGVYIERPPLPAAGPAVLELALAETHSYAPHHIVNYFSVLLNPLLFYALVPVLPLTYDFACEMQLEVRGEDGAVRPLSSAAQATAYASLDEVRGPRYAATAAAAELHRRNWNELTRQLVQTLELGREQPAP